MAFCLTRFNLSSRRISTRHLCRSKSVLKSCFFHLEKLHNLAKQVFNPANTITSNWSDRLPENASRAAIKRETYFHQSSSNVDAPNRIANDRQKSFFGHRGHVVLYTVWYNMSKNDQNYHSLASLTWLFKETVLMYIDVLTGKTALWPAVMN